MPIEKKYQALFENSITALFITRPDGTILEANQAACRMFGYSEKELKELGRQGIIDKNSPGFQQKLKEREETGSTYGEAISIRKNGERFWCEFSSSVFDDPDGGKLASLVLFDLFDNGERQESLKGVMNNVPGVIYRYVTESKGFEKSKFLSGEVKQVLGFNPGEIFEDASLGWKNIHEDDLDRVVQSMKKSAEENTKWVCEYRYNHPDGSMRWLKGMGNPVSRRGGQILWDSIVIDITEEKQAELDFKLLESVVTEANDAVLITKGEPIEAPNGPEIIYVNRSFEKMTGYKAEEVIGKTPRILQGPDTGSDQLERLRSAVRNRQNVEVELINYSKDGEEHWVNISLSPIFEGDKCTHFISIQKDITDRKLRELQESLSSKISQIFNREETVRKALQASLDEISSLKLFDAVEFWLVDRDQALMKLAAHTVGNSAVADLYEKEKKFNRFQKGVGLPGMTWEKRKNLFWRNLDERDSFIRREQAAKTGLKSAFSFPVMDADNVMGVLVLLVREDLEKERYYVNLFKELANQFASEISRKELEEELSRIFISAPDIICIAGLDGYYKKINPAMSVLLGYSEEELLSMPIIHTVHPLDKQKTIDEFEALNRGEGSQYFENRHITKSGRIIWLLWTTKLFYDEKVTYSVAKDITGEKELRDLLEQANRLAKIGSWEVDLINEEVYWSDITREIHEEDPDFEPDLESGLNYYKEGEHRERIEKAVEEMMKHGTPWDLELPIITGKGNERWIRTIGRGETVDGKMVRIYGSFQDIHERKTAEERLKNISNNIPGVLFQYELDSDGNDQLFYVSKGSKNLWGFTSDEAMSDINLIWSRFHKKDFEKVNEAISRSAKSLTKWYSQWRYNHPDGSTRWHEGFGTPQKYADGSIKWDSIVMDVTEKKKLEELVDQTNRLAKIGNWELNLRNSDNEMYWSEITKEILEVDEDYNPTLTGGFEFYSPDSKEKIQLAVEKAMSHGEPFDLELLISTAKGNERWIRCIAEVEMEDGECVRLFGSFQNIHQRKVAELAYKEALEEKNRIFESISDAFYAIDRNWTITYFNSEAENLLGKKSEIVVGNSIWEEFPAAKGTELYTIYHRVMEQKEPESFEYYYPPLNSWYDVSAYPAGKGISVYFKNIDERKEVQRRILKKTNQIDAIAHFNSLLIQRENWLEALDECLESFGGVTDADRVYYFENKLDDNGSFLHTSMRLEWVKKGVEPEIQNPLHHHQKVDLICEIYSQLSNKQPYNMIVSDIEDPEFREMMQNQNIKSLLLVPVFSDTLFKGYIGFDDCRRERQWDEEEITFLQTIAINLASAIENDEAEKSLQEAFEEKNEILESIGDAFFTVDHNWTVTYWNIVAENITGMPRDEIVGENIWEQYEDAVPLDFYTQYHKAVRERVNVHFEEYYHALDIWVEVSAYPSDRGLSVYFKDITKRKENEEKIKQINERFEKVTKATNDAIWDFDVQNENLYWGKGFEALFGYDLEKVKPTHDLFTSLIHPDDRENVIQRINLYMNDVSKIDWFEEYRFQRKDGSYAYVMDRAVFIRNKRGEVIRVVGAIADLTRQKEYEESLKKLNIELEQRAKELATSNAELEQFAFVASHDLQEPLRMVTSFLAQLERKYEDVLDEKGRKYIYFATDGARRMRQIILDLLEFSRIGRVDDKKEPVDLNEIAEEVLRLNKKLIEESKASIEVDDMPQIVAAEGPMRQLFLNLINNALKYRKDDIAPIIKLEVSEEKKYWKFSLTDNGIGINPMYSEKIFYIFQRLHGNEKYEGTGMGLAICKKIIEGHGGEIWMESEEGKGSTFHFTIEKE